jgi:hypothetical protein
MTSHDQRPISRLAYPWPAVPYDEWSATGDTLHMHTQVLGKLAVARAPQQWQLGHAALRLTARGWETALLPAPDRSGSFVAALDLHAHEAVVEHSDGRARRVPLTPNRSVGAVTRDVLHAVESLVGPVKINTRPQEVQWGIPLDEDDKHSTYDSALVADYLAAASRAAQVLAALRGPFRGRATPVDAWWGSFDLAVHFFNGRPADPPRHDFIKRNSDNAEQIVVGWWPGDARYRRAAFYGFASPAPGNFAKGKLAPPSARWEATLGEYILDWHDVIASPDPFGAAFEFGRSVIAYACTVCDWDPALANSAQGIPPPVQ